VDTVAYHLSVLRDMYPSVMNVLSLFSGIGVAEVALHRLGLRMKTVVLVEKSEVNRTVLRTWWDQTQSGTLIEMPDIQTITSNWLESTMRRIGSFDLVVGGSPCDNFFGSTCHRNGLEGVHSSLFHHYVRIMECVQFWLCTSLDVEAGFCNPLSKNGMCAVSHATYVVLSYCCT
jgi:site-specific DNA-cytosine methylase